jgi:hypothetical protein
VSFLPQHCSRPTRPSLGSDGVYTILHGCCDFADFGLESGNGGTQAVHKASGMGETTIGVRLVLAIPHGTAYLHPVALRCHDIQSL